MSYQLETKSNIWIAASEGDENLVRKLIEAGVSPNAQDEHGYSPL
jgi:ankyrin repeat protein